MFKQHSIIKGGKEVTSSEWHMQKYHTPNLLFPVGLMNVCVMGGYITVNWFTNFLLVLLQDEQHIYISSTGRCIGRVTDSGTER